jgi:hypothetical protein
VLDRRWDDEISSPSAAGTSHQSFLHRTSAVGSHGEGVGVARADPWTGRRRDGPVPAVSEWHRGRWDRWPGTAEGSVRIPRLPSPLAFHVAGTLTGAGRLSINLRFERREDFTPVRVATHNERLRKLLVSV